MGALKVLAGHSLQSHGRAPDLHAPGLHGAGGFGSKDSAALKGSLPPPNVASTIQLELSGTGIRAGGIGQQRAAG